MFAREPGPTPGPPLLTGFPRSLVLTRALMFSKTEIESAQQTLAILKCAIRGHRAHWQ